MINAVFLNSFETDLDWNFMKSVMNKFRFGQIEEGTQLATLHWEVMGGFECGSGISEYFSNLLLAFSNATHLWGSHRPAPERENSQWAAVVWEVRGHRSWNDCWSQPKVCWLWTHTNLEPLLTRWPPTWLLGAIEVFVYLPSLLCRCFSCTRGRWGTGAYPSSRGEGRLHPAQITCSSQRRTVHTPPIRAN